MTGDQGTNIIVGMAAEEIVDRPINRLQVGSGELLLLTKGAKTFFLKLREFCFPLGKHLLQVRNLRNARKEGILPLLRFAQDLDPLVQFGSAHVVAVPAFLREAHEIEIRLESGSEKNGYADWNPFANQNAGRTKQLEHGAVQGDEVQVPRMFLIEMQRSREVKNCLVKVAHKLVMLLL